MSERRKQEWGTLSHKDDECPKDYHGRHCWRTMGSYGHAHNDCKECHGCGITREAFEASRR